MRRALNACLILAAVMLVCGCPKQIPQPEIDAAQSAFQNLDATKDCAPESYQAAKTMMERAQALLKEERFDEAKTALLAAKELAEKAKRECDEKKKAEAAKPKEEPAPEPAAKSIEVQETDEGGLLTVHFAFNESALTDEAQATLSKDADYLMKRESLRVQIEGHCDSRGSTEYNLALGERRAIAVRQYLVKLGVNPSRMDIISYGEERPVDDRTDDAAYGKNRRAEFNSLR